jgi:eukaryotic-like serine/threonine-protein kinase
MRYLSRDNYYDYLREIGAGAEGKAYLATSRSSNRTVVIKRFPSNQKGNQRALLEASILERIPHHLNIIRYLEHYQTATGNIALVIEYVPNTITLEKYIQENSPINLITQLKIMIQLTDAVRHLHLNYILHRDIKPANILIKDEIPILIDFDLACITSQRDPVTGEVLDPVTGSPLAPELRCTGVKGTPLYQDPDFTLKPSRVPSDLELSDIYSLGATFYSMLSGGRTPYDAEDEDEFHQKLRGPPDPLDPTNPDLESLIMEMISKDRNKRPSLEYIYDTLSEILKAL